MEQTPYKRFLEILTHRLKLEDEGVEAYSFTLTTTQSSESAKLMQDDLVDLFNQKNRKVEIISSVSGAVDFVKHFRNLQAQGDLDFSQHYSIVNTRDLELHAADALLSRLLSLANDWRKAKGKVIFIANDEQYREVLFTSEFGQARSRCFFEEGNCIQKESLHDKLHQQLQEDGPKQKKHKL